VGADGARAIADALRVNSTLQALGLSDNGVGADGARAIAGALRENSTLQKLYLSWNNVGDDAKKVLRESWGNRGGSLDL